MDLGTLNQCINDDVKGRYCLGGLILPLDVLTNVTITSEAIVCLQLTIKSVFLIFCYLHLKS